MCIYIAKGRESCTMLQIEFMYNDYHNYTEYHDGVHVYNNSIVQEELHLHELVYTNCTKTVVDIVGCMLAI